MIAYVTFLLLLMIVLPPIAFVIAFIVNIFRIPKMVREILDPYSQIYRSDDEFDDSDL